MRKTLSMVMLGLFSISTASAGTVLRCNIPWGELQEAKIVENAGVYTLIQLNNVGATKSYPMTAKQWEKRRIPLHLSWGEKAVLFQDNTGWNYKAQSGDFFVLSCDE